MSDSSDLITPPESPNALNSTLSGDAVATDNAVQLKGFQLWVVTNKELTSRLAMIAFVVGFMIVGTALWLTDSLSFENAGYGGVWIVSFIASGSIILPVPGLAAVCIAAAPDLGLNPVLIGVISASAEALGEMTGFVAGLSGRSLMERNKFYPRMHSLVQRRGGIILFIGGIVPNPLFDVLGIAAGSIGYPIKKFLIVVFVAKAIKSTAIAYACFLGIEWVQGIIG